MKQVATIIYQFPRAERATTPIDAEDDLDSEVLRLRIEVEAMHRIAIASLQMSSQLANGLIKLADCDGIRTQQLTQLADVDRLVSDPTGNSKLR